MARIRAIHPRAPQDEDVASLPMEARVLWAYLPCYADREGRLEDRPLFLKGQVFPADNVNVGEMLTAFAERGWIIRYQAAGKKLIQIVSFHNYQRPDHHEKDSVLPGPQGWVDAKERRKAQATPRQCLGEPAEQPAAASESFGDAGPVIRESGVLVIDPPYARDPSSTEQVVSPGAHERVTGQQLLVLFGKVRNRVFPETLPWDTARDSRGDAEGFARLLGHDKIQDIEPSMQLALEHIRDGAEGWKDERNRRNVSFAFGSWKSGFHSLREEIHGRAPGAKEPAKPTGRSQGGLSPALQARKAELEAQIKAKTEGARQ